MPLFDWSETSASSIVTRHFWVYWAATIPLTLITIIVITVWIFIQEKKNTALSLAARDTVGVGGGGGYGGIRSLSGRSVTSLDLRSQASYDSSSDRVYSNKAKRAFLAVRDKIGQVFHDTFRKRGGRDVDEWFSPATRSLVSD